MNIIYKIKKNWRTGHSVVVSELCCNAGKKSAAPVRLLALCGGILFNVQAIAGAVNGQYNYQDYMDFGNNLGRFTPGATNIPFYLKKNTDKITPDYVFNYPVPDFSAIDNKRIATLLSPGYVVSAAHVYFGGAELNRPDITGSKTSFDHISFGDSSYHQVAINRYENKEKSPDLIIPRLNKFVVEADPVSLIPDNVLSKNSKEETVNLINDKSRFPVAVRTGAGLPRIYQATINAEGQVSLFGVDADDKIARQEGIASDSFDAKRVRYSRLLNDQAYRHITGGIIDLTDTETPAKIQYPSASEIPSWAAVGNPSGFPASNRLNYHAGYIITDFPYFTNIPYNWTERGDSGSPLFTWDNATRRWELIGVGSRNGRKIFTSRTDWTVVSKSIVQPTLLNDIINIPLDGRQALWDNTNNIVATDASWQWQGIDSLPASDNPKHIRLTGGGKITLAQSINMAAGGLFFDSGNNYTIEGQDNHVSWHGAGLDIGAGSTVQWKINGVNKVPTGSDAGKDDYLHKVGKGTLEVYTANAGGLKLGDGTVILKTASAFSDTFITSGRGTLKLDAENALNPQKLRFATRGGTLDLNGYNMDFNGQKIVSGSGSVLLASGIRAQDYGAVITNNNMSKTSTVSLNSVQRLPISEAGYLFPGRFTGNLNINSSLDTPLVFNGGIDTPNGVLQRNGGDLQFQGEPVIRSRIKLESDHNNLKELLDKNNTVNEDPRFSAVKKHPGFNLPDSIVENQQEFNEQYWNTRKFTLQTINATHSRVTIARNSLLSANISLDNSPLTIGYKTVYIDRNAGSSAVNRLESGQSVASHHEDQARYQGNINARTNSPITIQNSQLTGSITADETSPVTLGSDDNTQYSEWRLSGDSNLHSLTILENSALYFHQTKSGSNNASDWNSSNTLTVENLASSNNHFYFGINPQTMESDKLIVNGKATGANNIINLHMFFSSADQSVTTDREGDLLLARTPGASRDFFSMKPVNIGFSLYNPNITTTSVDGKLEWRLAIGNGVNIMLDASTPSVIKPSHTDATIAMDTLAVHDDLFSTHDTAAVYDKERQDAEEKELERQREEERKKLPVPVGEVGNFFITDLGGEPGGKFLSLSEDAKIYIYFGQAANRFVYILEDGGTQYEIKVFNSDGAGKFNVTYDSSKFAVTGNRLPTYARKGQPNEAVAIDIATGSVTKDDFVKLINDLPADKYSKEAKDEIVIPGWALAKETPETSMLPDTTISDKPAAEVVPVPPASVVDNSDSAPPETAGTDATRAEVTPGADSPADEVIDGTSDTTISGSSGTGDVTDESPSVTDSSASVVADTTETTVTDSPADEVIDGTSDTTISGSSGTGDVTAESPPVTDSSASVVADATETTVTPAVSTTPVADSAADTEVISTAGSETAPAETPASETTASTSPPDDTVPPATATTAGNSTVVPVVSFFTRTDNQPLMNKVENVMQMPQVSFVMETNQLNKRLGDVRHLQQDTGVWLKPGGGIGQYGEMKLHYSYIQGGIDTKRDNHFYGFMVSRTSSSARGGGLIESHTTSGVGLYYSWVPDTGPFVDVIGKYLKNRQNLQFPDNSIAPQKPESNLLIGSVQTGYRLQSDNGRNFIEPGIEIVAGHISGYSIRDNNVKIDLQTGTPVYAKAGFNAGKNWQLNDQQSVSVIAGVFRLQNLKRGGSLSMSDRLPGQEWQLRSTSLAATDNRYLGSLSVNAQLSSDWRLYAQAEVSFADSQHYNLNGHIGIRYQF